MKKLLKSHAYFALIVATLALAINFWAWSLLSPLGSSFAKELSLNPTSLSLLLSVPVVVGAVGRIVLGMLTDRFGGRKVFAITCLIAMVPVIALGFADSYSQLLLLGIFLGIGGASFAIGVPYVSAWFPRKKLGLVIGLYSMGNIGTAISGLLTPRLDVIIGRQWTFFLVAFLLFIMAIIFIIWARDSPNWKSSKTSVFKRLFIAARSRITWDLSVVYAITFGAFVAFGVYLPVLLNVAYGLTITDAATRAAGFVLVAIIGRPVGGWFSDKIGGKNVIRIALLAVIILAVFVAPQSLLELPTTVAYLSLAFALGCANGAVFALVGRLSKPDTMGSVTGIVGAVGGLGGFLPPLILGFTYQHASSYFAALIMLAVSAFIVLSYIHFRFKKPIYKFHKI